MADTSTRPSVSVIILGWNGRDYVDDCLSSLLDQDYQGSREFLFVDNGSSDGTADRAEAFAGVRVLRLDRNHGYCVGNNIGFEHTNGDVVVFLNQDVVLHRSWLRELVAAVNSDPAIQAAHANVIQPWYPEAVARERIAPILAAYTADLSPLGFIHYRKVDVASATADTLFLHCVAAAVKRTMIEELGYAFDPGMWAYAEDMDLALRVRSAGYRTVVATRAVVYHKHTLAAKPSLATLRKTVRIIRNRLLALWKCSTWPEFMILAAVTIAGSPLNAGEFGMPAWRRTLYAALLVPPTLLAVPATVLAMPTFAARRAATLSSSRMPRWWLFRAMLRDTSRRSDSAT